MKPLSPLSVEHVSITDTHVHNTVNEILQQIFPAVEINGYTYHEKDLWNVLVYASANRESIHMACQRLSEAPSSNWLYTTLKQRVLTPADIPELTHRLNEGLEAALPKGLTKRAQKVAIDLTLIPFYGDEATPGVYRSQAKQGTTKFFCFASAYVIKKHKRATLCVRFVESTESLKTVLTELLDGIHALGIRIKRLYLDREFARVDVLSYLTAQPYVSIVPIPKKGQALKALLHGKKSLRTTYTMRSAKYGQVTFPLWMACRYAKGRAKRHGCRYLLFAVIGTCRSPVLHIADEYRQRFGIETSYRIMNQARAKTTSRKSMMRLLLVGIAFLLTNVWVWFKWNVVRILRSKKKSLRDFPCDEFRHFLRRSIERLYGTVSSLKL
jgi:putative transposase